ncbi:MAG: methylated-DNA--[protein]-cysteine S-methyltransferase [Acinetobacter sp.]|nr:methylated-DNA--[protein]-cysteine S-methyltransferase [Acinetobacter sp.]
MSHYAHCEIDSPVGRLYLLAQHDALLAVLWPQEHIRHIQHIKKQSQCNAQHPILLLAVQQLDEYFQGQRQQFTVPLAFQTGTAFQQHAWHALQQIPYGQTWTYQQQAHFMNNDKAVRAVGAANGQNPLSIIVPCHRVIGKNGQLVGFGGGLDRKMTLLALEQRHHTR